MPKYYDLIKKNGDCLTPSGRVRCDVGVKDGTIVALDDLILSDANIVFDAKGLHILPGIIDT